LLRSHKALLTIQKTLIARIAYYICVLFLLKKAPIMQKFSLFLVVVFLFLGSKIYSQNITLSGKLVDTLSGEALSYAAVSLQKPSVQSLVGGQISDEKGSFKFEGLKKEVFQVKIEYVGYKTKWVEVSLENTDTRLDLGAIKLAPLSQLLDAVTVSGQKQTVVATLEKQIFKTEQFESAKGGTATDALRNIPSVSVNAEGEITVRGSKGFLILVNGKPSQVDAATLLGQIPANTIEKIEMITAPSAKYDADGKAGIINIVTKKGTNEGISVVTNAQYGFPRLKKYDNLTEPQRYGFDATLTFRKAQWDASFSANYLKNDIAGRRVGDVNTLIKNISTQFPSMGERSFKRDNYGIRAVVGFKPDKANEFSAGFYRGGRTQYRRADIFYNNTKTNILTNTLLAKTQYFNPNLVKKEGTFNVFNLDYNHVFVNGLGLTLSGLYENADLGGYTKNANLNIINNFKDTIQNTLNNGSNPLDAYRFKIDVDKKMGIGKLSAGYQYRNQQQNGVFEYLEKQGNLTPFILNPAYSARIDIFNRIHAFYSQYAGKYKTMDFSAGLRYENAFREFKDNRGTPPNILKLSNFFPSANMLFDLGKDFKGKMAYSRRVQRSTNNELNPYPEREHSETLEQGDPSIKPEFIGIYELGIIKDFKKGNFYWNAYTQQITNIVNRVNSVFNDTILNRIYTNAGKAQLWGSEAGLTLSPIKNVKVFLGGNVYNLNIQGSLFDNKVAVNSKGWVHSINTNISWQIVKTMSAQFNLSYLSARNTAQGEDSRFYLPNFSLKKAFLNNKLTTTLQWQNIAFGNMATNEQRITTYGSNFYTTTNYIQETNIFMLNLSYSFNQSDKKAKLPSSEFGEKEY
jgi:ferric enterobactin receptor